MRAVLYTLVGIWVVMVAGCAVREQGAASDGATPVATISRTAEGIPHIRARDWPSLGYGLGYAQAQDNLCTLSEAFVTYRGERSRYFGPDGRPGWHATLAKASNLDSDFFFKFVDNDETVEKYARAQPAALASLIGGFVQGFNTYLGELKSGASPSAHLACRGEAWLTAISDKDIYRRLYAANLAGGYLNFMEAIVSARPPKIAGAAADSDTDTLSAADTDRVSVAGAGHSVSAGDVAAGAGAENPAPRYGVGAVSGAGSNGIALGAAATGRQGGLLLGNPHWYWTGPDRFYQARLTIPGELDVVGASFLGVPVIMIGFNRDVAWTHTVSTARRFGLFELALQPGNPTSYLVDGKATPMTPVPVSVQARQADGSLRTISRTLYMTQYGPVVDLAARNPGMGWSAHTAIAVRDINADNFRIFANFLAWDRASSLDAFIDAQKRYAAMPWVNTLAVGRADGRAWYSDIGAVPGVPDDLARACTTPMGKAFSRNVPGVPFLDGSKSECAWRTEPGSVQAGALPPQAMPQQARMDYVANMNNSYQFANPQAPMTALARILGPVDGALSPRARLGYSIAQGLARHDGVGAGDGALARALRDKALDARSMPAVLFKQSVLDAVCRFRTIRVAADTETGNTFNPPRRVSTTQACEVLRRWDDSAADVGGASLWDAVWSRIARIPASRLYARPFDAADPLGTPTALNAQDPAVAQGFGAAVLSFEASGRALDERRGRTLSVAMGDAHIPLPGGCDSDGYFTAACPAWGQPRQGQLRPDDLLGNTYLQVVDFGDGGGHAYTMLASGETDDPASPYYAQATQRYAARAWTSWSLYDPEDLGARWAAYRAAHPYGNSRDAGEYLGVAEAQLLAAELGPDVVLLRSTPQDISHMLQSAVTWGKALSVMRNEYGISERQAVLSQERIRRRGDGTRELDLAGPLQARIFPDKWRYVFSVIHYYGPKREAVRSLQAYDEYGESIVKLILHDDADNASFDRLTRELRADRQAIDLPAPRAFVPLEDEYVAASSLREAVRYADTPAAVEALLDEGPYPSNERLWRYWDAADVRMLDASAIRVLAQRLVDTRERVLGVVANRGMVQQYAGQLNKAVSIGDGWYSFQGEGIALHLHEPDITSGRVVRLHAAGGDVSVVEFIDTGGNVAVRFVDGASSGQGESQMWRRIVADLPGGAP